jgi:hypothetical protein
MAGSGRHGADSLLIAALLGGASLVDAAKHAGVSEQTVSRRLHNADFRARLDAAEAELVDSVARALADGSTEAVSVLRSLLLGSDAIRLQAARTILEFVPKWRVQYALEARVAALERAAAERQKEH